MTNRYAVIVTATNVVENIALAPDATSWAFPVGRSVVQSDTAQIGDVWNGSTFTTPAIVLTLAQQIGAKAALLTALYQTKLAAGRSYTVPADATGAHPYQIDDAPGLGRPSSQEQIAKVAAQAERVLRSGSVNGTPWDATAPIAFFFLDANNVAVPMTAQQAYDFATAIGAYCTALVLRSLQLKMALLGAASSAALAAIDITTGWPT